MRVTDARGEPAPEKLKVSISYQAGWRAFGRLAVSGPEALAKANRGGRSVLGRGRRQERSTSRRCINSSDGTRCHAPLATASPARCWCSSRCAIRTSGRSTSRFAPQLVPRVLGTVPGVTYIADQGRPKASEVVAFWPALVSRDAVRQRVIIGDEEIVVDLRSEQRANV